MFVVLSGRSKDIPRSPLTVPVRWAACTCKGRRCVNPSSRVAQVASSKQALINVAALSSNNDNIKTCRKWLRIFQKGICLFIFNLQISKGKVSPVRYAPPMGLCKNTFLRTCFYYGLNEWSQGKEWRVLLQQDSNGAPPYDRYFSQPRSQGLNPSLIWQTDAPDF